MIGDLSGFLPPDELRLTCLYGFLLGVLLLFKIALLLEDSLEVLSGELNHVIRPVPYHLLRVGLEDLREVTVNLDLLRGEDTHL